MGFTSYCVAERSTRSATLGYATRSVNEIFTQQKARKVHPDMDPKGIKFRECRDSEAHPNAVPVILSLDLTGSMLTIPAELIKEGLPTLMSKIIQKGVDASLLFMGIGDHECDHYPLQVGQFESGDEELDGWLTKTYLEAGGGSNAGESYLLAWEFVLNRVKTDAWDKRKERGIFISVGDEPCLPRLPKSFLNRLYSDYTGQAESLTKEDLYNDLCERFDVYHINVSHTRQGEKAAVGWKSLMGQRCIETEDFTTIPNIISDIVISNRSSKPATKPKKTEKVEKVESLDCSKKEEEEML